jgi:NAD(P)-dependent dehydrogenase (short-subunit alcohol dehydrogenase family)
MGGFLFAVADAARGIFVGLSYLGVRPRLAFFLAIQEVYKELTVESGVYNASKAALHAYSNTLRVELAPFGVRVITIVTGGVKSNIARVERELPEGSLYVPVNEEYQRRLKYSQEGAMPNEEYARLVVSKIIQPDAPKLVWEGNKSWVVWFAYTFLPTSVLVRSLDTRGGKALLGPTFADIFFRTGISQRSFIFGN